MLILITTYFNIYDCTSTIFQKKRKNPPKSTQHAEWTLNKVEKTFNDFGGEREGFRGSEYILFEIPD